MYPGKGGCTILMSPLSRPRPGLTEYQYDAGYSAPVAGAAVADGGQSTKDEPVYLYESATGNNTYLIIQGTYANKDYYYKMAVIDKDGYLMDILRNREYHIHNIESQRARI